MTSGGFFFRSKSRWVLISALQGKHADSQMTGEWPCIGSKRSSEYAHLRNNKKEIESLFDDLLINVTRFFRDEALFRVLKKRFLPALRKRKRSSTTRIAGWVPGAHG